MSDHLNIRGTKLNLAHQGLVIARANVGGTSFDEFHDGCIDLAGGLARAPGQVPRIIQSLHEFALSALPIGKWMTVPVTVDRIARACDLVDPDQGAIRKALPPL